MRLAIYIAAAIIGSTLIFGCGAALSPKLAHAYTLGAADSNTDTAPIAKKLGATTYRVVIDPREGLEHYAPRIDAYQALGMRPQLVIGGTGTSVRGKTAREGYWMINTALAAHKRWPGAYSISIQNEPDLSGASACRYAQNFRRAYKALKKAGVKRVLFGEWSPTFSMGWTPHILQRCGRKGITADGYAWHCYDAGERWHGIGEAAGMNGWLRDFRRWIHTPAKRPLGLYCTEYGALTRGGLEVSDDQGAVMWRNALRIAGQQNLRQIVAWGIEEAHSDSSWDSSLRRADGSFRPAFHTIENRN